MIRWDWLDSKRWKARLLWCGADLSARQMRLFAAACCRRLPEAVLTSPAGEAVMACEQCAEGELAAEALTHAWEHALRWAARSPSAAGPVACALAARSGGVEIGMIAGVVAALDGGGEGLLERTCRDYAKAELRSLPERAPGIGNWLGRVWGGMTDGAAGYDRALLAQHRASYRRARAGSTALEQLTRGHYEHFNDLLLEIGGRPADSQPFDLARTTPTILSLAQAAYEERAMPSGVLDAARLAVLADALEEAGACDEAFTAHLRAPGPHVRGCWALDLVLGR